MEYFGSYKTIVVLVHVVTILEELQSNTDM